MHKRFETFYKKKKAWCYFSTGKICTIDSQSGSNDFETEKTFGSEDRIGILIDFRELFIQFFVNQEAVANSLKFSYSSEDLPLIPALSLNSDSNNFFEVMIMKDPQIPSLQNN